MSSIHVYIFKSSPSIAEDHLYAGPPPSSVPVTQGVTLVKDNERKKE